VQEKLALEVRDGKKREALEGRTVLDQVQKNLDLTRVGTPAPDRDVWKVDAMKRIAEKHQSDYDMKDFEVSSGKALTRRECERRSTALNLYSCSPFDRTLWVSPSNKHLGLDLGITSTITEI
jgi:hypothetical protein